MTNDTKPMSAAEFISLSSEQALMHLKRLERTHDWSERDRLRGAWWDAHRTDLDSTVLAGEETDDPGSPNSTSQMLQVGRALTGIGFVGAVLLVFLGVGSLTTGGPGSAVGLLIWSYLMASLGVVGVLFWVAGALEQRLIEIRDKLPDPVQRQDQAFSKAA